MRNEAKKAWIRVFVGCAVIASPFAVADNSGLYSGIGIGQSRARIYDAKNNYSLAGITATLITVDGSDTGYKLTGGYKFNKSFNIGTGCFNPRKFGCVATTAVPAETLGNNIKLDGMSFNAVGILPVTEKFSTFVRGGFNYTEANNNFSIIGNFPVLVNPNPSKREKNYRFGLGLQYDFSQSLGMKTEAERYRISDAIGNNDDINFISIGLVYRIGEKASAFAP